MDATMQTVLRLHEQGIPRRTIAKRAGISLQKVRKILITAGAWSDETSEKIGKLRANGMSVPEIAEELGVKTNTVWSYLPYSKGMYNQEYPTINAIRVRNSKRKAKEKALTCTDTAQNEGSGACCRIRTFGQSPIVGFLDRFHQPLEQASRWRRG